MQNFDQYHGKLFRDCGTKKIINELHSRGTYIDGNSEIGAYGRSNLCNLILVRHLIRLQEQPQIGFLSPKRPNFLYACETYSELPSNLSVIIIANKS